MARTKIVATLGPATRDIKTMRRLIRLGVDVFRLNFSHGNKAEHARLNQNIRRAAGERPIAVIGDLTGPKLRCGPIENDPVLLKKGNTFVLTAKKITGSDEGVSVNYKNLPGEVKSRERIFLDDGNIELQVKKVEGPDIHCRILIGGLLRSHKGINLPNTSLSIPSLTKKDREMIRHGVELGVDFFALSFVKEAEDIKRARRAVNNVGAETPIIAKIEKHEAAKNLEKIIEVADGAMVARGDLGVEIPIQEVPILQKRLIRLCNESGKPVITATQMLESMMKNPRPTRAEVTDIANAIIDGTDAIMLSGETAIGQYPCRAVEIMDTVAQSIEKTLHYNEQLSGRKLAEAGSIPDAISLATCHIARALEVAAILCLSATGYTARFVARYRPRCPILVYTLEPSTQRRLNLTWGVVPFLMEKMDGHGDISNLDALIRYALETAQKEKLVKSGQRVVVTAGLPLGRGGTTNMLRIFEV